MVATDIKKPPKDFHKPTEERLFTINKDFASLPLESFAPKNLIDIGIAEGQKAVPRIAKDSHLIHDIEEAIKRVPTTHRFINHDSRDMSQIPDESVHLIVTSPPYWILKKYPDSDGQLGHVTDYEEFLEELDRVWKHVFRVLVPGGRLVIVVGDVCLPRKAKGRHVVVPLHASIQEHCRTIGFDNLAPIIWYKIANAKFEANRGSSFLGKPYEPNAIVKNDIEYILFQRKPGGNRSPSLEMRILSVIPEPYYKACFKQVWDIHGASTKKHPAPYPVELAERLIRMFSFVDDTVLDPFSGTGTTALAAAAWGRNSINFEIERSFFDLAVNRFGNESVKQLHITTGETKDNQ